MFERLENSSERAVLVHITFPRLSDSPELREFVELCLAAGAEPVTKILGSRPVPDPKFFVGKGKLEEIKAALLASEAQLVLFNHELSPAQERNVERVLNCRVLSRTGLILDIFAQRARTFEGKLQVELAQLEHLSSRLVRRWTHLERQKGGIGLRGPGETQLESDKRMLGQRIEYIKKRLNKVKMSREQSRRARTRQAIPTVALVGYTNAGKSTLFNALTNANVYVANQLFATLDPTLRMIELPDVGKVILADTVGFISHLPHGLIKAFRATLEEVNQARLLLHVVDAQDDKREDRIHQVNQVLAEIEANSIPQLIVFNKADLLESDSQPNEFKSVEKQQTKVISVSALTGYGIDRLRQAIQVGLNQESVTGYIQLMPNEGKIRALFYQHQAVLEEQLEADGCWKLKISMTEIRWRQLCQRFDELADRLHNSI